MTGSKKKGKRFGARIKGYRNKIAEVLAMDSAVNVYGRTIRNFKERDIKIKKE